MGNITLKFLLIIYRYLTGNPCTDYEGYREYVIAVLGQLKYLDNIEIQRSDRIKALQRYNLVRNVIIKEQAFYRGL